MVRKGKKMTKPLPEYDLVKNILIKHDVLNKDIEDLDDPILITMNRTSRN